MDMDSLSDPKIFKNELAAALMKYIQETEVPILSEFCVQCSIYESAVKGLCSESELLRFAVNSLENKKRAALERKIYSQELNATIGAHLLKRWHEEAQAPPPEIKYRCYSLEELDEAGISREHQEILFEIERTIAGHYD